MFCVFSNINYYRLSRSQILAISELNFEVEVGFSIHRLPTSKHLSILQNNLTTFQTLTSNKQQLLKSLKSIPHPNLSQVLQLRTSNKSLLRHNLTNSLQQNLA